MNKTGDAVNFEITLTIVENTKINDNIFQLLRNDTFLQNIYVWNTSESESLSKTVINFATL